MEDFVKIPVEICREGVTLPKYAKYGDAGMDVRAAIDVTIPPLTTKIVPTGLKVAIPSGYEIQVRPRSGLSLKTSIRIPNAPGTIDSGYRDEIGIIVHNCDSKEEIVIKKDDRIAQIVLQRVPLIEFELIDDITAIEGNRGGGFGSSGVK